MCFVRSRWSWLLAISQSVHRWVIMNIFCKLWRNSLKAFLRNRDSWTDRQPKSIMPRSVHGCRWRGRVRKLTCKVSHHIFSSRLQGVLHTISGYMLYTATTFKLVFDYQLDDVYWCTADIGWITGHSYITYGPLANGATSVLVSGGWGTEGFTQLPVFTTFRQLGLLELYCDRLQVVSDGVQLKNTGQQRHQNTSILWSLFGVIAPFSRSNNQFNFLGF